MNLLPRSHRFGNHHHERDGVLTSDDDGITSSAPTDGPAYLPDIAQSALRGALRASRPDDAPDGEMPEMCEMLRLLCDTARERGLQAEHLLLVLKDAWRRMPEAQNAGREDGDAVLARTISLCIGEFYRSDRGAELE